MSDQSQAPIFFRPSHQLFVEGRNDAALNWDVLYLNVGHQITGAFMIRQGECWSYILKQAITGIIVGGLTIPLLAMLSLGVLQNMIRHGLPYWGVIIYNVGVGLIVFVPLSICGWIGIVAFKQVFVQLRLMWNSRRIEALLQQLIHEGQLIRGQVLASKPNRNVMWAVTYRFTTPSGKQRRRVFYSDSYQKHAPGTPIWVLYLNDKISVLL